MKRYKEMWRRHKLTWLRKLWFTGASIAITPNKTYVLRTEKVRLLPLPCHAQGASAEKEITAEATLTIAQLKKLREDIDYFIRHAQPEHKE